MTIVDYDTAKREFDLIENEANERKHAYLNNKPDGESMLNDFLNSQTEGGSIYELKRLLDGINLAIDNQKNEIQTAIMQQENTQQSDGNINELMSHDDMMLKLSKFSNDLQVSQPLKNIEKKKTLRNKIKVGVYSLGIIGACVFIATQILKTGGISVEIDTPRVPMQNLIPNNEPIKSN